MAVADQVKKIIVEQLGVDEDEVTPDASFVDDLGAEHFDDRLLREIERARPSARETPGHIRIVDSAGRDLAPLLPELTDPTYEKLQAIRNYYTFQTLAMDRYAVNGVLTPTVVGVRQINDADLPAQTVSFAITHAFAHTVPST